MVAGEIITQTDSGRGRLMLIGGGDVEVLDRDGSEVG